ncbi:MAG: hypothetical protein WDO12_09290 [Pseudomonadota bacterium]
MFQVALGMTLASTTLLLALAVAVIWGLAPGELRDPATRTTLSLLIVATLAGTFTALIDGQFRASGQSATARFPSTSRGWWNAGRNRRPVMFRSMVAVAAARCWAGSWRPLPWCCGHAISSAVPVENRGTGRGASCAN